MLTLGILLFLCYSFYAGARRGVMLQGVYTIGYIVAFIVARLLAGVAAPFFEQWVPYPSATLNSKFVFFGKALGLKLDSAFYYGISFLAVLGCGWLIVRLVVLSVHELEFHEIPDVRANWLAGGLLNLLCGYVFLFLVLYLLALVPVNGLQDVLGNSRGAVLMVRYTPILSQMISSWWIVTQ